MERGLLFALCLGAAFAQTCDILNSNNLYYDLRKLRKDYVVSQKFSDGASYTLSGCEEVSAPSPQCDAAGGCIGYQIDSDGDCWCLGKTSQVTWGTDDSGNLQASYRGGSKRVGSLSNSAVIVFQCAKTEAKPSSVTEKFGYYIFTFNWQTPAACGTKSKPSGGSSGISGVGIFDVIIVCAFFGFIIFGSIFNAAKGQRGLAVIPLKDFWLEVPHLVKDGVFFCIGTTKTAFYRLTGKTETI